MSELAVTALMPLQMPYLAYTIIIVPVSSASILDMTNNQYLIVDILTGLRMYRYCRHWSWQLAKIIVIRKCHICRHMPTMHIMD